MVRLIQKTLSLIVLYVVMQLVMMLLAHLLFGVNLFELDNNTSNDFVVDFSIPQLKLFVLLNQVFGLFLPALLFLLIWFRKGMFKRIELQITDRAELPVLALALLIFSYPAIQFLAYLNGQFPISDWMYDTSNEIQEYMMKLVQMETIGDLWTNIALIAVLPALAEELFFRGLLQKELLDVFKKDHVAIITTAIVFSAFHFQFDGFLPRFGLGLLLGYAYYYTKSFFVPVLMHFTNNAIMVVSLYLNPEKMEVTLQEEFTSANYMVVIISFVIVFFLFRILKNKKASYGDQETI